MGFKTVLQEGLKMIQTQYQKDAQLAEGKVNNSYTTKPDKIAYRLAAQYFREGATRCTELLVRINSMADSSLETPDQAIAALQKIEKELAK